MWEQGPVEESDGAEVKVSLSTIYAVWVWNNVPAEGLRLSPQDLMFGTTPPIYNHLQRTHVFGCPTFVLDPTLQDGKKLPKWKKRSRVGVDLGFSRDHSSTVALILNLDTGAVSAQYHCVFDDHFSTVMSDNNAPLNVDIWNSLVQSNLERHPDIQEDSNGNVLSVPPDATAWDHPDLCDNWPTDQHIDTLVRATLQREGLSPLPPLLSPTFQREPSPPPVVSSSVERGRL
jgi:hypothetical protein